MIGKGRTITVLKGLACLGVIVVTNLLFFLSGGSWLVFLILFFPAFICGEWLSDKLFSERSPLNRFSTAEAGFSVWRILIGVAIGTTLLLLALAGIYGIDFLLRLVGR